VAVVLDQLMELTVGLFPVLVEQAVAAIAAFPVR
jgi:hypothetical protein